MCRPASGSFAHPKGISIQKSTHWTYLVGGAFGPSVGVPFGIDPNHVHDFNPRPGQPAIANLLNEGLVHASHERLRRGIAAPVPPGPPAPAAAGGGAGGGGAVVAPLAGGGAAAAASWGVVLVVEPP